MLRLLILLGPGRLGVDIWDVYNYARRYLGAGLLVSNYCVGGYYSF
jgi:hypothetical protein